MTHRVLILIKGLGRGGAEQLIVNAAPYLDRERFRYEVAYVLPWKDALVGELDSMDIPATCLQGGRGVGWLRRLRRLVDERRVDLVHAHSPLPAIGARLSLPYASGPAMIYTEHNVWDRYHRGTYWGNLLTFSRNAHVLAVSDEVRNSVRYPRGLRRLSMPTIETLHYGLDLRSVDPTSSPSDVREELGIPPTLLWWGTSRTSNHTRVTNSCSMWPSWCASGSQTSASFWSVRGRASQRSGLRCTRWAWMRQ